MTRFLLVVFIIWLTVLLTASFFSSVFVPFAPRFPYWDIYLIPSGLPKTIWSFANFDGVHYLTIAKDGYVAQFTQVFFPLYPLIFGVFFRLVPAVPLIIWGLITSLIMFLLSVVMSWKLYKLDYKSSTTKWIILFMLFFPTSFFFGSLYTESTFLLFLVSSFYFARKKRWFLASLFGMLASATRFVGIFLLPALLWEKIQQIGVSFKHKTIPSVLFYHIVRSPVIFIVPLGLLSYMLYLHLTFGDALYFWHVQPVFGAEREGNSIVLLPQVLWRYIKIFFTVSMKNEAFWVSLAEYIVTTGSIFLLFAAYRFRVRTSYLIFSSLAFLLPTLTGTLSSMPRYVLVCFPLYIALGLIPSVPIKRVLLFISFCALVLFIVLFTAGHWIS